MNNWEITFEVFGALGGFLTGAAAVAAAIAAFMGLDSWRHQATFQQDRDLARRVLIATFVLRDRVSDVRNPFMFEGERVPDRTEGGAKEISYEEGTRLAYSRRWSKVIDAIREVQTLTLEADAVWGDELRRLLTDVHKLNRELYNVVSLYLDSISEKDEELKKEFRTILKSKRDILYDKGVIDDVFNSDYSQSLGRVESYLRGKMGRTTQ